MKKIIFIEDETQDFEKFSNWMIEAGYEINSLDDSVYLIEQLKQSNVDKTDIFRKWFFQLDNTDNIGAFVLDIHLKINDFDGLDIKNIIRRNGFFPKNDLKQIPIFILTSDSEKDDLAHENVLESPDRYIVKDETTQKSFLNKLQMEIEKYSTNNKLEQIHNDVKIIDKKIDQILKIVESLSEKEKNDFENALNNILINDNATRDLIVDNFVQDLQSNNENLYSRIIDSGQNIIEIINQYCIINNDKFDNAQTILDMLRNFN